jgi:hypothetical protein
MCHIHTILGYSAIKKNEIVLFAGEWMKLEIIRLSKIRQSEKDKFSHVLSHMLNLGLKKKPHQRRKCKMDCWVVSQ